MNKKEPSVKLKKSNEQLELDKEKDFLLELGNDITRVREKHDLIALFRNKLKDHFDFTHIIVSLIDLADETYAPFLLDNEGSPTKEHPLYAELIKTHFSLQDAFIQEVLNSNEPRVVELDKVMNIPGVAAYLRANYDRGIRQILITPLRKLGRPLGFFFIYSQNTDSFTDFFRSVMKSIAPLLSSAISNIIKNEELVAKEWEKSILLEFTSAIAKVRTKQELSKAIQKTISKVNKNFSFIIVRTNYLDQSLSTFCYHLGPKHQVPEAIGILNQTAPQYLDGISRRILSSEIPLLFNVDREFKRGVYSDYLKVWQCLGEKNFVALRLQNGEINQGFFLLNTEKINVELLHSFCDQVSIAMANIVASELIITKQEEQSYLLDFVRVITHVQNREELKAAVFKVLDGIIHTKLAMIRIIADDGIHLPAFMYDPSLFSNAKNNFEKMSSTDITIDEPYTKEVLSSEEGVVFNVEEELKKGNAYAKLWKSTGLKNMYALPMHTHDKVIGTIWLLANKLNANLVRGLCAQISIAISNIIAQEKLLSYKKQLEEENDYLKEQIKSIYNFSEIIGSGERMTEVYRLMQLVAETDTTVLVLGETGTGKELIARAIHNASPRKDKLMVKVNCAALPSHLIESELFGHEKGAFTGAIDRRLGKFELAHNSTIFLDEIGELPLESQAKLLRVIQEKEIERIGGKQTIKVNVRLVAATNRNLEQEVRNGKFRADLYFRLNVFPIELPALNDRKEDIEALMHFFIEKYTRSTGRHISKVSPKVLSQLKSYNWPGNVRELEHLIERSILLCTTGVLEEIEIPKQSFEGPGEAASLLNRPLSEIERHFILLTLRRCGGKISGPGGAAEILNLPPNTLHSKMKKLAIKKSEYFD